MRQDGTYYWDTVLVSNDFVYNSNDTVYHFDKYDKIFYPLYRMNIKMHDTILIRDKVVTCTKSDFLCSRFEYVIDSVSSLSLQGNNLKVFYNSETQTSNWVFNRSWNLEKYPIIERIGSLKYFFGVNRNLVMEGGISCLRCYSDNQISYKSSAWQKGCDYLRPLNGSSSVGDIETYNISVFPNPFNTNIKLSIARQFELYDSFGRLLQKGYSDEINTELLSEGLYLLKLTIDKNLTKTIKIIKHLP
ncbi:MAG TPA: T9SS type A sorting domain-containing protein [Bacteroidales bacterium]